MDIDKVTNSNGKRCLDVAAANDTTGIQPPTKRQKIATEGVKIVKPVKIVLKSALVAKMAPIMISPTPDGVIRTKFSDIKGVVVVVLGWNNSNNGCYNILVYDTQNKKVYETSHRFSFPNPANTNQSMQIPISVVINKELELKLVDSSKSDICLSKLKFDFYKAFVYKDGLGRVQSYISPYKTYYNCQVYYSVFSKWSSPETLNAPIKNMNDCALFVLDCYKQASTDHTETQKVLDFKI
jgi:hypothetical protein